MPCNYNNVCFDCRNSFKSRSGHICPDCGREMLSVGYETEIPRKTDIKGWKKLEKYYILRGKSNPYHAEYYAKYLKGKK